MTMLLIQTARLWMDGVAFADIGEVIDEGQDFDIHQHLGKWKLIHSTPQLQKNGYDCGVHVLAAMLSFAHGQEPSLTDADAPLFRLRLMYELLQGSLVPADWDGTPQPGPRITVEEPVDDHTFTQNGGHDDTVEIIPSVTVATQTLVTS